MMYHQQVQNIHNKKNSIKLMGVFTCTHKSSWSDNDQLLLTDDISEADNVNLASVWGIRTRAFAKAFVFYHFCEMLKGKSVIEVKGTRQNVKLCGRYDLDF